MVQRWIKQIQKIESGWKRDISQIITDIFIGKIDNYDCQKMQWYDSRYRIRTGKYRVVYETFFDQEPRIINVDKRWDVYK
jgi:mRNA-degrading endonuclease RelE of RelBE toxin-antitoxin system